MSFPVNNENMFYEPVYTIGHVAQKLGIAVVTLRMYEKAGLLITHRTATNRRLYSRHDVDHIKTIMDLIRNRGLNLESIRRLSALAPCWRIVNCPKEIYEKCPAFFDNTTPCWLLAGTPCAKHKDDCRSCKVYIKCPELLQNPKNFIKDFDS